LINLNGTLISMCVVRQKYELRDKAKYRICLLPTV